MRHVGSKVTRERGVVCGDSVGKKLGVADCQSIYDLITQPSHLLEMQVQSAQLNFSRLRYSFTRLFAFPNFDQSVLVMVPDIDLVRKSLLL